MRIRFERPEDIEQGLRAEGLDLDRHAREVSLVGLYRQERITHHQLAEALGLTRLETEAVLKRYEVSSGVTAEEMRAQAEDLRDGLPKPEPSPHAKREETP